MENKPVLDLHEAKLTNLIWVLGDIQYMLMEKNIETMKRKNMGLRHDTRYRFNQMIEAKVKAKLAYERFTRDVMGLSGDQLGQYYEDCNMLRKMILLTYEKLVGSNENVQKTWEFLNNLKAEPVFDWEEFEDMP